MYEGIQPRFLSVPCLIWEKQAPHTGLGRLVSPFPRTTPVNRSYSESKGDMYMWYWNETGGKTNRAAGPVTDVLNIISFDKELAEKPASPEAHFQHPSQSLAESGMAVLRSDWSRNGAYMMILGEHAACGMGTSHCEGDATSFNLFAKGEYLVLEGSEGRYADGRYYLEDSGAYGHVDDAQAWLKPWGAGHSHEHVIESPVGHNLIQIDNLTGFRTRNVPGHLQTIRHGIDEAYIENFLASRSLTSTLMSRQARKERTSSS